MKLLNYVTLLVNVKNTISRRGERERANEIWERMSLNGYQISSISYSVLEEQIAEHSMAEHFIIRYSFYWNPLSPSLVVTEQWNRNDFLPTYLPTYLYIEHLYSILDSYQRRQSPARWNLIQSFVWNKLWSILICPFLSNDRGRNCIKKISS